MSITNVYYSMYRFVPKSKKFDINNDKDNIDLQIFNKNDNAEIYKKLKDQNKNFIKQNEASRLQHALNQLYVRQRELYDQQIQKIILELNNINYNKIINTLGSNAIQIEKGTLKINKNLVAQAVANHRDQVDALMKDISKKYTTKDDLNKIISRLNGSINKTRGDIFEYFLSSIFNMIPNSVDNILNNTTEEVINLFQKNFSKASTKGLNISMNENLTKTFVRSKVTGGELKESINVTIKDLDNETTNFIISGSQGKSDLFAKGLDGSKILKTGISAKNYSGDNNVTILSNANITGLISNQPTSATIKSLALNGLSAKSVSQSQRNLMRGLFFIQGLMGLEQEDIKAELFILNTNVEPHPFVVLSIYDLLFTNEIRGKYTQTDPISYQKRGRTTQQFIDFIKEAKISIHTQLTVSKLSQFANIKIRE